MKVNFQFTSYAKNRIFLFQFSAHKDGELLKKDEKLTRWKNFPSSFMRAKKNYGNGAKIHNERERERESESTAADRSTTSSFPNTSKSPLSLLYALSIMREIIYFI
jgi:hypothetical protein